MIGDPAHLGEGLEQRGAEFTVVELLAVLPLFARLDDGLVELVHGVQPRLVAPVPPLELLRVGLVIAGVVHVQQAGTPEVVSLGDVVLGEVIGLDFGEVAHTPEGLEAMLAVDGIVRRAPARELLAEGVEGHDHLPVLRSMPVYKEG